MLIFNHWAPEVSQHFFCISKEAMRVITHSGDVRNSSLRDPEECEEFLVWALKGE